ncbi:sensor domain-containing diguanylate cyclase [Acidovorax kalamii]|uniref:sensor domain-containing diguanylate cyclase n=1 Tax=Acidovorax kalamii TaxID=2004485 RepID=UPI0020903701|nr:sensor domain-containing diguanylate cyclase [Acidovorax kalamii]MCO5358860.1 sensor domain-containing diguanylate cyclase [Acidovorax kalamii]
MLAVDDIPCAMMITDPVGHIVRMNREFLVLIGGTEAFWLGHSMDELLTPASRIFSQTHLFPTLHHAKSAREVFLHLRGFDGETVPVMINAVKKRLEMGDNIVWAFFVARERSRFEGELIKARAEAQALAQRLAASNEQVELQNRQLSELSLSDPLTGLKNRRALELTVQDWQRSASPNSSASLLMVDVDYFKRINDAHGHPEGDRVLVNLARQLQAGARGSDLVARYGGEEFVVWLPDAEVEAAARVAERVHKCARRVRSAAGPVTVSVGLACAVHETGADFLARLLKRSDEAVYSAKALGRNCTVVRD